MHLPLCRRCNGEAFQQIREEGAPFPCSVPGHPSLEMAPSLPPPPAPGPLLSSSFLSSCSVDGASIFSLRERSKWPINSERRGSGVQPKIVSTFSGLVEYQTGQRLSSSSEYLSASRGRRSLLLQEIREGKKGKSYFPDSLTVIRTGTEASASSLSRLAQSGTTQENVHKIRLAMAISALLSRSLSDLDLGTSL